MWPVFGLEQRSTTELWWAVPAFCGRKCKKLQFRLESLNLECKMDEVGRHPFCFSSFNVCRPDVGCASLLRISPRLEPDQCRLPVRFAAVVAATRRHRIRPISVSAAWNRHCAESHSTHLFICEGCSHVSTCILSSFERMLSVSRLTNWLLFSRHRTSGWLRVRFVGCHFRSKLTHIKRPTFDLSDSVAHQHLTLLLSSAVVSSHFQLLLFSNSTHKFHFF